MPIQCEIVTQERLVYTGEADYVSLPGVEGRMGILPNHSPLLTALGFGEVMVRIKGQEEYFAVGGGFAEVRPDRVVVLADSAERADEIDVERAERARRRAEEAMAVGVREDPAQYEQIEASLRRAKIRIDVSLRHAPRRRLAPQFRDEEDNHGS